MLPERAIPNSPAARMLGRLSKRREVNIRWRYYRDQINKVRPPLMIHADEESATSSEPQTLGLLASIFQDIVALSNAQATGHPTSRWLRRRYRELLARLPILSATTVNAEGDAVRTQYSVKPHPDALNRGAGSGSRRAPSADLDSMSWIRKTDPSARS